MLRLGLCCIVRNEPIRFRTTATTVLKRLSGKEKLENIITSNANALIKAFEFCHDHNIGSFRINSQILPVKTHPEQGYTIADFPNSGRLIQNLQRVAITPATMV